MGNNPVGSVFAGIAACIGVTIVLLVLLYLRLLHVLVDTFLRLLLNYYLATMYFFACGYVIVLGIFSFW